VVWRKIRKGKSNRTGPRKRGGRYNRNLTFPGKKKKGCVRKKGLKKKEVQEGKSLQKKRKNHLVAEGIHNKKDYEKNSGVIFCQRGAAFRKSAAEQGKRNSGIGSGREPLLAGTAGGRLALIKKGGEKKVSEGLRGFSLEKKKSPWGKGKSRRGEEGWKAKETKSCQLGQGKN